VGLVRLGKIKCAAKVGWLVGGFAALFILRRVGLCFDFLDCRFGLVLSVG